MLLMLLLIAIVINFWLRRLLLFTVKYTITCSFLVLRPFDAVAVYDGATEARISTLTKNLRRCKDFDRFSMITFIVEVALHQLEHQYKQHYIKR